MSKNNRLSGRGTPAAKAGKSAANSVTLLSLSMIKKNKSRSILIVISILLTTLSLMTIASYGYGILKWNKTNASAFYGSFDAIFSGVSEQQLEQMKLCSEIGEIGLSASAGTAHAEDADMGLMCADDMVLEMSNLDRKLENGNFPERMDEIAAQPGFFRKLGYDHPSVGDIIEIPTRFSKSERYRPETFTISGLIEEKETQGTSGSYTGIISSAYYESKTTPEERSYHAYFRLTDASGINSDNGEEIIKALAEKCGVEEPFVNINAAYLTWSRDPGGATVAACALLALMVIFFSVMVIVNIFQTGIAYRVQEYGKIRALGATKRQMKKIVFREGMILAIPGIPMGLLGGYVTASLSFDWILRLSESLSSAEAVKVSLFSFPVLLLVAAVSALTVWLALKRPMKIVASLSPVEAMRYQGASAKNKGIRKGRREIGVREMTLAGLTNNKKRTVTTIITMGMSCVLFVVMANFAGNMDAEYDARKFVPHGQFQLELDYSLDDTAYPENNLDSILKANPLGGDLTEQIRRIPGVTSVTSQQCLAAFLPADRSEEGNGSAKESQSLSSVVVFSRVDFEREKEQGSFLGDLDYDKASEENGIFYGFSPSFDRSGFELGETVELTLEAGDETAGTALKMMGSFGNINGDWAITEDTYRKLGFSGKSPGILWIDCDAGDVNRVQTALYELTSGVDHMEMASYEDALKSSEAGMKMMKLFTYGLTLMIALISFMNMANTMITGIIVRKREFGVLQAIGMTNSQLNKMLQGEGLFFTAGTAVISVAAGIPLGYALFSYGKNHSWIGLHEYHLPVFEVGLMIAAIAVLQLLLSWILSRNVKKESLVERIRYQG